MSRLLAAPMLAPLRYPQYRRYYIGNLLSVSAMQMMWVAQGWLVYDLTGSKIALGLTGLVTALPAILLNLVGGVLADRLDQRKMIAVTQFGSAAGVLALAVLISTGHIEVWHIFVVAFSMGALQAFSNPARQSIFPQLIEREHLMQAVSLNSMVWQGTRVIAPAIGGILIDSVGMSAAYFVSAAGFLALAFVSMTLSISRQPTTARRSMLGDLGEGLSFIRVNFLFAFLIGMSFFSSFFGNAPQQLMPVFARDILDVGGSGLGLLFSLAGLGSVCGVLLAGLLGRFERKGLLLIGGSSVYGVFMILFAMSDVLIVSLATLFMMSLFMQLYLITLQSTLQMRVPDELRGRVMGVYGMTYNVGPLGALQAGLMADAFGAPAAVAVSGVAIIAFSLGVASTRSEVRQLQPLPSPVTPPPASAASA